MELTKNQIQEIENYIEVNNVDYLDLKIELLDHIVSDIEYKMNKGFSFESALQLTKQKWSKHFRSSSSIFLGLQFSTSKVVLKKAVKEFRSFYVLYIISCILPFVIFRNVLVDFTENTISYVNSFLKISTFLALLYFVYIIFKVSFSKEKTTYSFILKTQYLGISLLFVSQFFTSYFDNLGKINIAFICFSCAGFATTYTCHHFYKKHLLEIAKNKKRLCL
ncbi:MAG: hypothetical protein P8I51_07660 [Polaribacter sp.]|jgi:hypothetical protein|nr:hypothetical protein [Polaribacter sp.]MDG1954752.1 hypothetical protein [Polaribacter sp.]MDG2074492.1 hypothetical protein [Polaribacter sp.]